MTETVAPPQAKAEAPGEVDEPFVGLRPFTAREADFFFGREDEIRILVANLRAARLTLLYGPSGVGKSSILAAGVADELRSRARDNLARLGKAGLAVAVVNAWRDDPVRGIANAVERAVVGVGPAAGDRPSGRNLGEILAGWSDVVGGPILVILDQFEEYFHYHSDEGGEGSFASDLAEAITRPDLRANFLVSIREDVYAKLDLFTDMIPELFENYIRLDHLGVEGARAAIQCPIAEYNRRTTGAQIAIEPKLVEAILEQVRPKRLAFAYSAAGDVDESDEDRVAAPFLQLVLERVWHEERREGSDLLRRSTLRRLGETRGIVEGHVRLGLAALSEEEQDVAAQAFRFLATRSGTKVAHSGADLADFTGLREARIEPVLEKLVRAETRILHRLPAPRPRGAPRYELYHDLLAEAVLAWRSDRLAAMEKRAAEAEARAARRRANLFRSVAAAMVVVAGICLVLLFIAIAARRTAVDARRTARAQKLVAQSAAALGIDPDGALRLAERALEVKPTREAESAFRTAVGVSPLRVAIQHGRGAILRAAYSGDGRRVLALGTDKTVTVSDARTGRLISRIGYGTNLRSADLSRDGRIVVTAGWDNAVRFWNADNGARLASFGNPHLSGAWLDPADGRRAVATAFDGRLLIWRIGSRKPFVLRSVALGPLTYAAFSPDGSRVVVIGRDKVAWLFDARTGALLHTLVGHIAPIDAVAWSADGRRIVTGGSDLWAYVWDVQTGRTHVGMKEADAVNAVAFSADGAWVATAAGKRAHVWDSRTGEQRAELRGHSDTITYVDFRRDGRLLATASNDGTAKVWDVASETTLRSLLGSGGSVSTAAFSPDGRFILSAGDDRTVRIWSIDTGLELWRHTQAVLSAAFSPSGRTVLTGGRDYRIVVSDARSGKFLRTLPDPPTAAVNSIRFSPNAKLLAVATDDPALAVRNARTGAPIATLRDNTASVFQAVFSPDSKAVAVANADGSAGVFDARTGALRRWLHAKGRNSAAHPLGSATGIGWSPDGRFLVTSGTDSQLHVWNARTGRFIRTLWGHVGAVASVAFAPDADRVVTAGADRTAFVWDVPSGRKVAKLSGDPQALYSAAFSPNGRWVVTGDAGGIVRVWDWRQQKLLAALPMHADFVNAVSFSPDGKRILSASDDWSAKIYRCTACISLSELRYRILRRERLIAPP